MGSNQYFFKKGTNQYLKVGFLSLS